MVRIHLNLAYLTMQNMDSLGDLDEYLNNKDDYTGKHDEE